MSAFQWLTKQFVPARIYAAMEAESRQWVMDCPCGHVTSVWEMGGVRYLAKGEPVQLGWRGLPKEVPRPRAQGRAG